MTDWTDVLAIENLATEKDESTASRTKAGESAAVKGTLSRKAVGGKIADKLKTFEAATEEAAVDLAPPPPPPPSAPASVKGEKSAKSSSKTLPKDIEGAERESSTSKKSHKSSELPGSFPVDNGEDAIAKILYQTPEEKKKSKKSKTKETTPPPPPVPDAPIADGPLTPPPTLRSTKGLRPKINDEGASWARWSAAPAPQKDERKGDKNLSSSKSKSEKTSKRSSDKHSAKDSGSDKADRNEKHEKADSKARIPSTFTSMPPISRSMSTREKEKRTSGRSASRRHSIDTRDLATPPPPELGPEVSSKAAKILGFNRSSSMRKPRRSPENDDAFANGARDTDVGATRREKRRSRKVGDDEDAMAAEEAPIKRSTSTSKKSGFSGLFSGLMTPRSARGDPFADADAAVDEASRDARHSTRRTRDSEREHMTNDDSPRERRRKRDAASEARRVEEKAARKAERHTARQQEDERRADDDREARRVERRRMRKEQEAAALADESRKAARMDRRASQQPGPSQEDAERRRRREERRAARAAEGAAAPKHRSSQKQSDHFGEEQVYPQKELKRDSRRGSMWPHSGTSSWVKDHSDAPPPPDDSAPTDDDQARREGLKTRRRAKYGDLTADEMDEQRRRRARREGRERERRAVGSEGSDERHQSRRNSMFVDPTPRTSWWRKFTG